MHITSKQLIFRDNLLSDKLWKFTLLRCLTYVLSPLISYKRVNLLEQTTKYFYP